MRDHAPLTRHDRAILRLLRDAGPSSRTVLATELAVSPTTITKTVAPLIERGYLEERGAGLESRIGRPAIPVAPVPSAVTVCGVQIGVGVVHLALADGRAHVRAERSLTFDTTDSPADVLDRVAAAIKQTLAADSGAQCIAIGVGAPGPVDAKRRTNLMSVNLGWRQVPIADLLEARLGIPAFVDHNVRTMALAEALYGSHNVRDLAYVYVKSGVGLGLVLDGKPFYAGLHGLSELGHVRTVEGGKVCTCGARGCLETVVSEPYLLDRATEAGLPDGPLLAMIESGVGAAPEIRSELVDHLAGALANVVNLFNPQLVLLGGIFESMSASLLADIRTATREAVYPFLRDEFHIRMPSLSHAGVVGGAALALEEVLYGAV